MSIVNAIEAAIEGRLEKEYVESLYLGQGMISRIYYFLDQFHLGRDESTAPDLPDLGRFALRPFLYESLFEPYTYRLVRSEGSGRIKQSVDLFMEEFSIPRLKRLLLISDSVVIPDFLFYYTWIPTPGDDNWFHNNEHIGGKIRRCLMLYAELRGLIESGIVLFMKPWQWITPDQEEWIASELRNIDKVFVSDSDRLKRDRIVRLLVRRQMAKGRFDILLDGKRELDQYNLITGELSISQTSRQQVSLQNLVQVSSMELIDPEKVSVTDLLAIRKNESAFDEWRRILSKGLKLAYQADLASPEEQQELSDLLLSELLTWRHREGQLFDGNFWKSVKDSGKSVVISATSGSLAGALLDNISEVGPLSAAIAGLLGVGKAGIDEWSKSQVRSAIRAHAMTVLSESELAEVWKQ